MDAAAYLDVSVEGDRIEQLLTDLFTAHWAEVTVGPLIGGAAYEIQFAAPPKLTMLDGYRAPSDELARIRRVARAAFFTTEGGSCAPQTWGLRLWNGRGEQMITILFPNPHFDEHWQRLHEPRWERTALWRELRRRYAGVA